MLDVRVHSHALKHGLDEENVIYAWRNYWRMRNRDIPRTDQIIAIGFDRKGRLIQMVGVMKSDGILVYHALTPPTESFMRELGLDGR